MGKYTLPDLPYDYGALAPYIAGEIMELHHSKHHQTYVNGLNTVARPARRGPREWVVRDDRWLEKRLAFNWADSTARFETARTRAAGLINPA